MRCPDSFKAFVEADPLQSHEEVRNHRYRSRDSAGAVNENASVIPSVGRFLEEIPRAVQCLGQVCVDLIGDTAVIILHVRGKGPAVLSRHVNDMSDPQGSYGLPVGCLLSVSYVELSFQHLCNQSASHAPEARVSPQLVELARAREGSPPTFSWSSHSCALKGSSISYWYPHSRLVPMNP